MSILIASDQAKFFPLVHLPAGEIETAIARAQAKVEEAIKRKLEISEYSETLTFAAGVRSIGLSYLPVAIDLPQVVKVRSNDEEDWQTLGVDEFDIQYGRLRIRNRVFPLEQVQITYSAGIDFSRSTQETYNLKQALGQVLTYLECPGLAHPQESLNVFNKYRSRGVECQS